MVTSTRRTGRLAPWFASPLLLVAVLSPRTARAADLAPVIDHAPVLATKAKAPLRLYATFQHADRALEVFVIYRSDGSGGLRQAAFRRAGTDGYVAEIPADHVIGDTLRYSLEARLHDGTALALFASRESPHEVQLQEDRTDRAEAVALARLSGRRSVVASTLEYVDFGARSPDLGRGLPPSPDRYLRAEAGYTFRMLRDVAEVGLRLGVVRGTSPGRDRQVGLNYGAPHLRLRALPLLHFDFSVLTSVTEIGFSLGGGAAVHIGDPYGTKLSLGFETVQVFGTRGYSRLDVSGPLGLTLSPIVEVTDMPHATATGVRLLFEASRPVASGLTISARGGYQARDEATGGPTLGLGAAYAF